MKIGKKRLQEIKLLTSSGVSFNELDEKYKYLRQHGASTENILTLLDNKVCSFKQIVDRFKDIRDSGGWSCLYELLQKKKLFNELVESNKLTREDLKYVLNKIDKVTELNWFCENATLVKSVLNEFLLDEKTVNKFKELIESANWCKFKNIYTVFDYVEHHNKIDQELLTLKELNRLLYVFEFNREQKLVLSKILRNNEKALNILNQIVENNLQDQYSYESLKNLLNKDKTKKKFKLNF